MSRIAQTEAVNVGEQEICYPLTGSELAVSAMSSGHVYTARRLLLESISQVDLSLARDLSDLEVTLLSAHNVTQAVEAINQQVAKVRDTVESRLSISPESAKFLEAIAEPIEELRMKADLIHLCELTHRLYEVDMSGLKDVEDWERILMKINSFAHELLHEGEVSIPQGLPIFLVPALSDTTSQYADERSGQLGDLAVCSGGLRSLIEFQDTEHPSLPYLAEVNRLIGRTQYRFMNVHVTKTLCNRLSELQDVINWLDQQDDTVTDVQNLKNLRSAVLSLSDFSLAEQRDINYAESVERSERVKVQEFVSATSTNLSGVDLEDGVPESVISASKNIQTILVLELRKVRGLI